MGRLTRYLPLLFAALGLAMFAVAGWAYYADQASTANVLEVDRSALDELVAKPLDPGDYDVTLRIRNTSGEPQRVVGFTPT